MSSDERGGFSFSDPGASSAFSDEKRGYKKVLRGLWSYRLNLFLCSFLSWKGVFSSHSLCSGREGGLF